MDHRTVKCVLGISKGEYTDDNGKIHEYDVFNLTFENFPVSVRVKPADSTCKEILLGILGK